MPVPTAPVPQTEVPQTPPNPLPMMSTSMGNTQLNNTPYQTFGQGYGAMQTPSYGSGPMPSLTGGYPLNQTWGAQGYAALPNLPYSADALFGPPLGYPQNQVFDQGYLTSPGMFQSPGTMYDIQGMYTPGQTWGQDNNSMAWNTSYFPEIPSLQPPNQIYNSFGVNHTAPSNPPQTPENRVKSNKIVPFTPPRHLRPLLPRSDPPAPAQAEPAPPPPRPSTPPPRPSTPPPQPSTPLPVPASLAVLAPAPSLVLTPPSGATIPAPTPATPPQSEGSKQRKGDSPYREWLRRQSSYRNAVKSYRDRNEDRPPGAGEGSPSRSTSHKPPRKKK